MRGPTFTMPKSLFLAASPTRCSQRLHRSSPPGKDDVLDAVRRRVVRPSAGAALGADQHPQFLVMRGAVALGAAGAAAADDRTRAVIRAGGPSPASAPDQAGPRRTAGAAPDRQCRGKRSGAEEVCER